MLFARAISNGVKWFTPDVFSGPVYVPEEMENLKEEPAITPHEVVEPDPVKKSLTPAAFAKAISRIEAGEDLKDKLIATYNLTDDQLQQLQNAGPVKAEA